MATYSGTPRTWVAGETVTAALLNSELRDPLAALAGAWNTWTPQLDQGATTNIAKTVNAGKYLRIGKLVIGLVQITATGTGTAGSLMTLTLPVTASGTLYNVIGSGMWYDSSAGSAKNQACVVELNSTTKMQWAIATAGFDSRLGVEPNVAIASGDGLHAHIIYEAA